MAELVDLVAPGLGAVVSAVSPLLKVLYDKYSQLKEGKELCCSLHTRLEEFAKELDQIDPAILHAEVLLPRLKTLIKEYTATVTKYADERNFVKRVTKVSKFLDDIKFWNERLDSLIQLLSVRQLAILVEWRNKFKQDAEAMTSELSLVHGLSQQIWLAMKKLPTRSEIKDLVLKVKRDEPTTAAPSLQRGLHRIIAIAEKDFLAGKAVEKPPTWLIAADEVDSAGDSIDSRGLTSIFVARWQGVRVAVKKFNMILEENPVFDKHLAVWRTLTHPNVAQLYGAGSSGGAPFFVYEYASHQSIDRCWNKRSQQELWHLLHQAAVGLSYLHRNRVVHGNLSCSKLLVTDEERVKIFGFGASYVRDNSQGNSIVPVTRDEFAAPECVILGQHDSTTFASDIYSFGLTIMETIGKKDPFKGMSSRDISEMKQGGKLQQPTDMDDEAWCLVQGMCAREPSKRVSLEIVADQLERFARQESCKWTEKETNETSCPAG